MFVTITFEGLLILILLAFIIGLIWGVRLAATRNSRL